MNNREKILKEICNEEKIIYENYSDNWIKKFSKNNKEKYIIGYTSEINDAYINQLCNDKSALSEVLSINNIANVKHILVDYLENKEEICKNYLKKFKKIVCKDNHGSGGENIYIVEKEEELNNAIKKLKKENKRICISPYYEIEQEIRVIIFKNEIELIYKKIDHI